MARVYLSIGSNLGDRAANLRTALDQLNRLAAVRVAAVSPLYETAPVGVANQPDFLNGAAAIETELSPLELLAALKAAEASLGRSGGARWGPRLIDLDIVLWDDLVLEADRLRIPHPEFRVRAFVLAPLCDLAPDARDPETGRTVRELLDAVGMGGVRLADAGPIAPCTEPLRLEP